MEQRLFSIQGYKKYSTPMKVMFWVAWTLFVFQMVLGILAIFTTLGAVLFFPLTILFGIIIVFAVLYIFVKGRAIIGKQDGRYTEQRIFSRQGYKKYTTLMKVMFWVACSLVVCDIVLLILDFFTAFNVIPLLISSYIIMVLLIYCIFTKGRAINNKQDGRE